MGVGRGVRPRSRVIPERKVRGESVKLTFKSLPQREIPGRFFRSGITSDCENPWHAPLPALNRTMHQPRTRTPQGLAKKFFWPNGGNAGRNPHLSYFLVLGGHFYLPPAWSPPNSWEEGTANFCLLLTMFQTGNYLGARRVGKRSPYFANRRWSNGIVADFFQADLSSQRMDGGFFPSALGRNLAVAAPLFVTRRAGAPPPRNDGISCWRSMGPPGCFNPPGILKSRL